MPGTGDISEGLVSAPSTSGGGIEDGLVPSVNFSLDPSVGKTDVGPLSFLTNRATVPGAIVGTGQDFLEGIGSSVENSGQKVWDIISRLAGGKGNQDNPLIQSISTPPDTPAGKIGRTVGDVGQFFLPELAGAGKLREAITAGAKAPALVRAASAIGRGVLEAAPAGAITYAQTENPKLSMINALVAGSLSGLGAAVEQPLVNKAVKMEAAAVKAPLAQTKAGFDPANIFKYDLGGSLKDTAAKTIEAIRARANQLHGLLQNTPVKYNLNDAIDATEQELLGSAGARAKNATFISEVKNAIAKFRNDAAQIQPHITEPVEVPRTIGPQGQPLPTGAFTDTINRTVIPGGEVDLLAANGFKRSVGLETNFEYGERSREAKGIELVANSLYSKLRQGIENVAGRAGPQIKQVNKELGELIPIERAVIRRLPIDSRQNMISLGTLLSGIPAIATGDLRELALPVVYKASKSPVIANILQKAATAAPGTSGRLAAGAISEANQ